MYIYTHTHRIKIKFYWKIEHSHSPVSSDCFNCIIDNWHLENKLEIHTVLKAEKSMTKTLEDLMLVSAFSLVHGRLSFLSEETTCPVCLLKVGGGEGEGIGIGM